MPPTSRTLTGVKCSGTCAAPRSGQGCPPRPSHLSRNMASRAVARPYTGKMNKRTSQINSLQKSPHEGRVAPVSGAQPRRRADARHLMMPAKVLCCTSCARAALRSAKALAAARGKVQCGPAVAFAEMATFEVVQRALSLRTQHDEERARHDSVVKSASAAFKPASASATTHASNACSLTACASLRT